VRMAVPTTYNTCLTSGTPSGATTRLTRVAYGAAMLERLLIDIDLSPTDELAQIGPRSVRMDGEAVLQYLAPAIPPV